MTATTPMMQQYQQIKKQYPEAILFFRLGDFYEMFGPDAELASRELEIVLTSREAGNNVRIPMCGVPYHAAEGYIARLIEKGYRVAICEQVEDPRTAKGIVKREVIRVVTPGTVLNEQVLPEKQNNYLVALVKDAMNWGLAVADVSTGEFLVTEFSSQDGRERLLDELARLQPAEFLLAAEIAADDWLLPQIKKLLHKPLVVTSFNQEEINQTVSLEVLGEQFGPAGVEKVLNHGLSTAPLAAAALLRYLRETQKAKLTHLNQIEVYFTANHLVLDGATLRNLELTRNLRDGSRRGTVLGVLDHTITAMGGRLLKRWLEQPLLQVKAIQERLDAVEELVNNFFLREDLRDLLKPVYDLERLLGRLAYGTANARDLIALKQSLSVVPRVKQILQPVKTTRLQELRKRLDALEDVVQLIGAAIVDEPPVSVREGGIIKEGYHSEVDQLRRASRDGKQWLAGLEARERERTGIKSLKVGFNKVFGYYIEVTNPNLGLVPSDYQRKQTLANAERFLTPELKEYEAMILGAEERVVQLEYDLFVQVRDQVGAQTERIQQTAYCLAELDVLASLAEVAGRNRYVKPKVDTGDRLHIIQGRHPVVEEMLMGERFVPNDAYLDGQDNRLLIITGPNMGGKSTFMRQVALIVLLAQVGSFVPAESAQIGIVDRIFTRVGAADDLATGQSTFMVEMSETRVITTQATRRSLVILDELGRGTATWDGMAIAQAVIEHLYHRIGCKCLVSTHYHELADLENHLPGVKNLSVAVKEKGQDIIFLRRVVPGRADKSYGIYVAKLAGLPSEIVQRAAQLLAELESKREVAATQEKPGQQLSLVDVFAEMGARLSPEEHYVLEKLRRIDLLNTTPLQALNLLFELQNTLKDKK
ncbi:MAG: DNA mismatch repair protein MutS [Firmicutes bacterium]|nr:DNA mismatch repair protein MutS [Bacillota bacterium]